MKNTVDMKINTTPPPCNAGQGSLQARLQQIWTARVDGLPLELFALPETILAKINPLPDGRDYRSYLRDSLTQTEVGDRSVKNQCISAWIDEIGAFDWHAPWFVSQVDAIQAALNWDIGVERKNLGDSNLVNDPDKLKLRIAALEGALQGMWQFASALVSKDGMDGSDTLTDDLHAVWRVVSGNANQLLGGSSGPVPLGTWWAISGRAPGDDEETCFVMQDGDEESARRRFALAMFMNQENPEEARAEAIAEIGGDLGVHINSVLNSHTRIEGGEMVLPFDAMYEQPKVAYSLPSPRG
jgi:hypothetical protein